MVMVGWRQRVGSTSAVYADASHAASMASAEGVGRHTDAKVGVEWQGASSRLGFENGKLGFQFDSGYRMSLRLRKGLVGVYLRGHF